MEEGEADEEGVVKESDEETVMEVVEEGVMLEEGAEDGEVKE